MEEFPDLEILQWDSACWKCGTETSVVWPKGQHLDSEIGEKLSEKLDYVQRTYSNSLDAEVWGNICVHCDAYQGNHFVRRESYEVDPPLAECPHCGEEHEWRPDDGMGAAVGQGWLDCPDYGDVPVRRPSR